MLLVVFSCTVCAIGDHALQPINFSFLYLSFSLSFLHPMQIIFDDSKHFDIQLFFIKKIEAQMSTRLGYGGFDFNCLVVIEERSTFVVQIVWFLFVTSVVATLN